MIDTAHLVAETFVHRAEWLDETVSTNTLALELADDPSTKTPLLIGASVQTAGRGRGTNRWWSGDGTLMFSVLFDMRELGLEQWQWPQFSLGTAVSIAETIETFLPTAPVGLKWPNDVWIGQRKVCGILIEQPERAPGRLIAGIGLNVNTQFGDAPEELAAIATSMAADSGLGFSLGDVLTRFLQRWEFNIDAQRTGEWDLVRQWARLCVLNGRNVCVKSVQGEVAGLCSGIADDGALQVTQHGKTVRCYAGTVRIADA